MTFRRYFYCKFDLFAIYTAMRFVICVCHRFDIYFFFYNFMHYPISKCIIKPLRIIIIIVYIDSTLYARYYY